MSITVYGEISIAATAERVFGTLTDPVDLSEWLNDDVHVDLAAGEYRILGRFTPQGSGGSESAQTLLACDAPHLLRFTWPIRGQQSTVEIRVTAHDGGVVVAVAHTDLPDRRHYDGDWSNFWRALLENLRGYLERGAHGPRCDFAALRAGSVRLDVGIAAPAEAVFGALIEPEQLDRYIGPGTQVERRIGGRVDFNWGMGPIRILELVEQERLAYDWNHHPEPEPETVVTWTLAGSNGRTRLTLVHSGFGDVIPESYAAGWLDYIAQMKNMLEIGPEWTPALLRETRSAEPVLNLH